MRSGRASASVADSGLARFVILILAVLVWLPMSFFLGRPGLVFVAAAIVLVVAVGAMLAGSRRPS